MTSGLVTVSGIGLLLGFRHAFEPDHLAAVTTLATRQRSMKDALRLGAAWGAGHTISVGVVVLLLVVSEVRLPPSMQPVGDLLVAALLIGFGVAVLLRHARAHRYAFDAAHVHAHAHGVAHMHAPPIRDARRSLGFGIAHGLAGSGAIVVLLVATAATRAAQVAYFAAFGAGTIIGMIGVSAVVAGAVRTLAHRHSWATGLHLAAAGASIAVGMVLGATCLTQL